MKRLRKRFLKTPTRPAARPLPETRSVVEPGLIKQQFLEWAMTRQASALPAPQLIGRELPALIEREIQLTWSEISGADEYVLERAIGGTKGSFREVYRAPDRSYNDKLFLPAVWSYRVRASASVQAGKWSDVWHYEYMAP